jgi:hypothetical protein
MSENAASSSSRNRVGAASRCRCHQPSMTRTGSSASGVVRTSRFTAGDAAPRSARTPDATCPPPRTTRMSGAPRAKRDARGRSDHHRHRRRPAPARCPPAARSVRRGAVARSPHARAKGHVVTVRPPTAGWQADRENGYGRTPSNTAAYANKSLQELCRNCVRPTRKPRRTGTNTASHRRARDGRNPLIRLRVAVRRCRLVKVAGSTFQACAIDHSAISPFRINNLQPRLSEKNRKMCKTF